jgi:hypothetical protein
MKETQKKFLRTSLNVLNNERLCEMTIYNKAKELELFGKIKQKKL